MVNSRTELKLPGAILTCWVVLAGKEAEFRCWKSAFGKVRVVHFHKVKVVPLLK